MWCKVLLKLPAGELVLSETSNTNSPDNGHGPDVAHASEMLECWAAVCDSEEFTKRMFTASADLRMVTEVWYNLWLSDTCIFLKMDWNAYLKGSTVVGDFVNVHLMSITG